VDAELLLDYGHTIHDSMEAVNTEQPVLFVLAARGRSPSVEGV
jgi:hypothetical protein